MTLNELQKLIGSTLSNQKEICHVLPSDSSLFVNCTDGSNFYINILESKRKFIHDEQKERYIKEYIATHSDEDFAKDILDLAASHPGFLLYFFIFTKLNELGIIDDLLLFHLNDSIVCYEDEINAFTTALLDRLNRK